MLSKSHFNFLFHLQNIGPVIYIHISTNSIICNKYCAETQRYGSLPPTDRDISFCSILTNFDFRHHKMGIYKKIQGMSKKNKTQLYVIACPTIEAKMIGLVQHFMN